MKLNEQDFERIGFRSALLFAASSFLFYASCAAHQSSGWRYEEALFRAVLIPVLSLFSFYATRWVIFGRIKPLWISIKEPAVPSSDGNLARMAVAGFFFLTFMALISINLAKETLEATRDIGSSVDGVEQKLDLGITVDQR